MICISIIKVKTRKNPMNCGHTQIMKSSVQCNKIPLLASVKDHVNLILYVHR